MRMGNWKWGSFVFAVAALAVVVAVLSDATPVREAESRHLEPAGAVLAGDPGERGAGAVSVASAKDKGGRKRDPIAARVPILVIGDSLEVGTGPYLKERLGDRIQVFARRGRPSAEGLKVLRKRLRDRHGVVVFDLGSNDDHRQPWILRGNMRAAHRLIKRWRCMVVATVNPDRREPLNEVIRRIAERPNVALFDWRRITKRRPELLSEDGVHATPQGYEVRARQLVRTIRRCPVTGRRR
ncbi:MAG TPA: GDSL-type esterase/lipase family protein [Solirubrobacterales bacterium]